MTKSQRILSTSLEGTRKSPEEGDRHSHPVNNNFRAGSSLPLVSNSIGDEAKSPERRSETTIGLLERARASVNYRLRDKSS
jgi:hypothetical protein